MPPTPDPSALLEAERLASFLFSNQFLVAFDLWQQQCCYVSPQAELLLGFPPEQMSLPLLCEAIHPDDLPLVTRASELAMEFMQLTGQLVLPTADATPLMPLTLCFSIDYRLRCRNGQYRRLLRHNFVLAYSATGHPLVTGSLFTDITGHKTTNDVRFSLDHPDFERWLHTRKTERALTSDELSTREEQILALTLAGETTAFIAKSLFISYYTVKTHRRNIQRKLKACEGSRQPVRPATGRWLAHLDAGIVRLVDKDAA